MGSYPTHENSESAGDGGYGGAGGFAGGEAGGEDSSDYSGGNSGGGGGAAGRIRLNTKDASSLIVDGVVSPTDITGLFTWGLVGIR